MNDTPRHVVVGTAGHIDHGKSTLVRALTGTDPDRLPEEKRRGITIDLGFAHTRLGDATFSFVDVPGHEKFVHNMLAGATGIDLLLLVVAADESVMPQTREHLGICRLLGLDAGVVALTRIDLAGPELALLAEEEVRELVRGTFLEEAPIVHVSGATGEGLDDLRAALQSVAAGLAPKRSGDWPRLPVDRVFAAKGFGTVVTGTLAGAPLRVGQSVRVIPGDDVARIRGLQVHGATVDEAGPQRRVAVNLQGIDRERLARGQVLVPPDRDVTTRVFDAAVLVLEDAPAALSDGQRVRVHHGTAEIMGRLRLPPPGSIDAGARGVAQVRLEEPLAALPGDRFVLRRYSPALTIAGGVIADLDPPRWRRADPAWPPRVLALADAGPRERVALLANAAGSDGLPLRERGPRLGLADATIRAHATELARGGKRAAFVLFAGDLLVAAPALDALAKALRSALSRWHRERPLESGAPLERLRALVAPGWAAEPFRDWITRLVAEGGVALDGDQLRLASHTTALEGPKRALYERLLGTLADAGLATLSEGDWLARAGADPAEAKPLVALAVRKGEALRLGDGSFLAGVAWQGLVDRLRAEAAAGRPVLDISTFKELFGLSRKYAIPLLEKLDDLGVTQRVGNQRRVRGS